ncbi:MAG: hypothetical protein IJ929_09105, partial [Prevotella sp.]|nr:hypothetical protein [Prevotella sp.]
EIRHKSIKNPSNRKRKIDISTDEHIRNYQNWLIVARASRVTHRRSQELKTFYFFVLLFALHSLECVSQSLVCRFQSLGYTFQSLEYKILFVQETNTNCIN